MANTLHEYAFDVVLNAVVRVRAESEAKAREALDEVFDAATVAKPFPSDFAKLVLLTEASLTTQQTEGREPQLFELDGIQTKEN